MDIFSHWLWGVLVTRKDVNWKVAGPMSVLPDLLAFIPSFLYSFAYGLERTSVDETTLTSDFPAIAWIIYRFSHSIVIVTLCLLLSWWLFARFQNSRLEQQFNPRSQGNPMKLAFLLWAPWYVHIALDIPTHTLQFFPTPVFYPISDAMFDGVRWSTPIVWFSNVGALAFLWWYVLRKDRLQETDPAFSEHSS